MKEFILLLVSFSLFVLSPLQAENTPAPASVEDTAIYATNALGLRLYHFLNEESESLCISPYSIASGLAMVYLGTAGETRHQMSLALSFPGNPQPLAASFCALDLRGTTSLKDSEVVVYRANRLFAQIGNDFRLEYLKSLHADFSAPLKELDFRKSPPVARKWINNWVAMETEQKILNLLPENALTQNTRLVLVNTIYFKAPWMHEFPIEKTTLLPFTLSSNETIQVLTMQSTENYGYKMFDWGEAISIPYRGGDWQLLILLPKVELSEFYNALTLTPEFLTSCNSLPLARVNLSLPKFSISPKTVSLGGALQGLGMLQAFDIPLGSADFDEMAPRHPNDYLFLSNVFHKTYFAIDEKGTEAAAATASVMMRAGGALPKTPPYEVKVNRPFVFALQHTATGTCLFLGRIAQPTNGQ